jgi:two-component system sensor histidine kinase/response regulator
MKKILVIDDAEFILESTSTLLQFEGYNVITASNGREGYQRAISDNPDLILCDISMPEMDGYEVLDKVRTHSSTLTTPFIFLTAFTEKRNMRLGMEKGADDYLVKPFNRDELLAAINSQWKKTSHLEKQLQDKVDEVGMSVTNTLPHEFRTVLNQVIGSAKYMNENHFIIESDEIKELSDDILESAQRLLKITENYLIYTRIEFYAYNPEKRKSLRTFKTEEPSAMLRDIAEFKAMKYDRKDDLVFSNEANEVTIEISSESFHKIVDELIDNALSFSSKNTPIEISSILKDDVIQFTIKDNGRGMDENQIHNVGALVQFQRNIYEQQGIGLGLAISKKLVELHDGEFIIHSILDKGTEITFTIPLNKN